MQSDYRFDNVQESRTSLKNFVVPNIAPPALRQTHTAPVAGGVGQQAAERFADVLQQTKRKPRNSAAILLAIVFTALLVVGLGFRFYNIDKKEFWNDEVCTALQIAGSGNPDQFAGKVFSQPQLKAETVAKPNTSLNDVIKTSAILSPNHTILYYVLAYYWAEVAGSTIFAYRLLPALLSLLQIYGAYVLARQLFGSKLSANVAATLVAISPMFVLYAQEAKEYSFFSGALMLSCGLFLKWYRSRKPATFLGYMTMTVVTAYASIHAVPIIVGQALYGWFGAKRKKSTFLAVAFVGFLTLFSLIPFFFMLADNWAACVSGMEWTKQRIPVLSLIQHWVVNCSAVFLDLGVPDELGLQGHWFSKATILAVFLAEVGACVYVAFKNRRAALYIALIAAFHIAFFAMPDLAFGGIRSLIVRYMWPVSIALVMSVTYAISRGLASKNLAIKAATGIAFFVLAALEIGSCCSIVQADGWYTKAVGPQSVEVAARVLQSDAAGRFVLTDHSGACNYTQMVGVSLYAPKDTVFAFAGNDIPKAAKQRNRMYLFNTSKDFQQRLEHQGYQLKPVAGVADYLIQADRVNKHPATLRVASN